MQLEEGRRIAKKCLYVNGVRLGSAWVIKVGRIYMVERRHNSNNGSAYYLDFFTTRKEAIEHLAAMCE